MKTKLSMCAALLVSSFFISCDKGDSKTQKLEVDDLTALSPQGTTGNEQQQIPVAQFSPISNDSTVMPSKSTVASPVDWDSKIIKTASLKIEIKDFKKYNDHVHQAVKKHGAYVAQEEQTLSEEKSETVITIKVPVVQFENMINELAGADGRVMEKKIGTDDVTGQVIDTKARLEAKKQMRLKYLEFLKQSKNMAEVLQVQTEIDNIQVQIEAAASRVTFLTQQTAFSTINLTFYQPMEGFKPTNDTPSFLDRISAAFKNGAGWFAELFVGMVSLWPLLLVALVIYFGWRKMRTAKLPVSKA